MKIQFQIMILSVFLALPACAAKTVTASTAVEQQKAQPINVLNDKSETIAVIDPVTGKTTYQNGGDADQVIGALLKHISLVNNYHQQFVNELLPYFPKVRAKMEKEAKNLKMGKKADVKKVDPE